MHFCYAAGIWPEPLCNVCEKIDGWVNGQAKTQRIGTALDLPAPVQGISDGHEDEQDRAKHQAARRWIAAVNNWGQLGNWDFHVCRDAQLLARELAALCENTVC
ncbi:MAG: hypothetical protein ACREOO_06060 [bacterium]